MTEKEAKKELYSYLHSIKLEQRKLEQIEKIKAKLTKTTVILSDIPKGNKVNNYEDRMADNIARLLELINEHIIIMQEEEENLIRITKKIKQVEQPYRNILELRFVDGMKVEEVSVKIDRAYRYTKNLIKKSIKKYAEI